MQWFVTAVVLWSGGGASLGIFGLWQMQRDAREREERRVIAGIDQIKTQPQDPPAPYVARSPLADAHAADRAELAGIVAYKTTAAAQYGRPAGAHRADGPRDPRRRTWRRDTEIFAAIAEAASGEELVTVGPREKEIRCVRTGGLPALTAAGAVR